jgi:hypothetical protein
LFSRGLGSGLESCLVSHWCIASVGMGGLAKARPTAVTPWAVAPAVAALASCLATIAGLKLCGCSTPPSAAQRRPPREKERRGEF